MNDGRTGLANMLAISREEVGQLQEQIARLTAENESLLDRLANGMCNFTRPCGECEACADTARLLAAPAAKETNDE